MFVSRNIIIRDSVEISVIGQLKDRFIDIGISQARWLVINIDIRLEISISVVLQLIPFTVLEYLLPLIQQAGP